MVFVPLRVPWGWRLILRWCWTCRIRSIRTSGFEGGLKLTEELLKQKKRFTALMAFDDMTAFGAIRCLARAGLKVPDDCSVIGFDDVIPAGLSVPSLTTVRQPMEALGTTAVGIVMEGINAAIEEREIDRRAPATGAGAGCARIHALHILDIRRASVSAADWALGFGRLN